MGFLHPQGSSQDHPGCGPIILPLGLWRGVGTEGVVVRKEVLLLRERHPQVVHFDPKFMVVGWHDQLLRM